MSHSPSRRQQLRLYKKSHNGPSRRYHSGRMAQQPCSPTHVRREGSPSIAKGAPSGPGPWMNSYVPQNLASMMDGLHVAHNTARVPVYVPPVLPPINRYTLQELDLEAIMRNPQLRK